MYSLFGRHHLWHLWKASLPISQIYWESVLYSRRLVVFFFSRSNSTFSSFSFSDTLTSTAFIRLLSVFFFFMSWCKQNKIKLPTVQKLGDRHPNTIELASWLVHVLCYFKATWHQEVFFSDSWIHHGSTSCWWLYFTFLVKVILHFSIIVWVAIKIYFLLYILLSQNW